MNRILSVIGVVLVVGCGPPDGSIEDVDLPDGPFEEYWDNGQLMVKGTVKDGEYDGPSETYHENGELVSRGTFKDGVPCGEWFQFGETTTHDPC